MNTKVKSKAYDFGKLGWKVTIFAFCAYLFGNFYTDAMNSLYGIYGQMYGWERTPMALWVTISTWVSIAVVIFAGAFAKKLGPKKMLLIGFSGYILTFLILLVMNGNFALYALSKIVNASAGAFITGFGIQLLGSNWFPKKKGAYMGVCTMGLIFSVTFLNAVIGWFMDTFGTINAYYIFAIIIYVIIILFIIFGIHDYPEDEGAYPDNEATFDREEQAKILAAGELYKKTSPWTIKNMLKDKNAWLIGIGFGLVNLMGSGVNGQIYPAMMSWGFSREAINIYLIVALIPAMIYSWAGGAWDTKWGTKSATIWFVSGSCVLGCILIFLSHGTPWMYYVGMMLAMSSTSAGNNMTMSITTLRYGRYDFVNAWLVINVISRLVSGFGAYVVSALADLPGGYDSAYGALGLLTIVSAIIVALVSTKFVGRSDEEIKELMDKQEA